MLVLGAGAGADVLQAHYHGARQIDAVELNPQVVDLVRRRFADYAGGIYSAGVDPATPDRACACGRGARLRGGQQATLRPHPCGAARFVQRVLGRPARAVGELPLHGEALQDDLQHLEPGGLLAITRWVRLPPRDALKLFAAAVVALERSGVADPASRLALVRSWQTSTLLVKNGAFSSEDIAAIKAFCTERSFDVAFYPGMKPQEANRYNVVAPPDLFDGATALLGPGRDEFLQQLQVPHRPGHRRQAALLPLLQVALAARAAVAEGARRPAAARMGISGARGHAGPGGACKPAVDRRCPRPGSRWVGARRRDSLPPARSQPPRPRLLCGDRLRLHVHRDRVHPEVRAVPEPPALRGGSRAVRVSAVRRNRQRRLQALARRQRAGAAARGGGGGGSDRTVSGALPRPASLAVPARGCAAGLR